MVSHEEVRKERLHIVSVKLDKKNVNEEKLIAELCMQWGASRRTVREYIKIVKATSL